MKSYCTSRIITTFWIGVTFILMIAGCSGGGGGVNTIDDEGSPAPVDTVEVAYTGNKTMASVNQQNAEDLVLGAFWGGNIGTGIPKIEKATNNTTAAHEATLSLNQVTQAIKRSIRNIDIPNLANLKLKSRVDKKSAKVKNKVETNQISGFPEGYIYTLDINESTGSFTGSITYNDFSSKGLVISGSADINGTLTSNFQRVYQETISFSSLSVSGSGLSVTLIGSLSWGFDYTSPTTPMTTLTINMVIVDDTDSKTYWLKDYEIVTTYYSSYLTQTASGRYYDYNYGYVEINTEKILTVYYGKSWPSDGSLKFSGASNTSALLTFMTNNLSIDVDSGGNGTIDWHEELPTNPNQPDQPVNSQPIADAGLDQSVNQGATIFLDGSGSHDTDGDTLSYAWSFESCPNYNCPTLAGYDSVKPSFVAEQSGVYVVRLTLFDGEATSQSDTVTISVSPVTVTDPDLLQMNWQFGVFGTYIGKAGLHVSDLDNDGTPEIIASASPGDFNSNNNWYVLKRNESGNYDQFWRSEIYHAYMVRLALVDIDGDGHDDIVVGLSDGTIYIYDGQTLKKVKTLSVISSLTDLVIADLQGDGVTEIIASNGIGLNVYAAGSGEQLWSIPSGGGHSLAVGNVDTSSSLEIVTTTHGGKGYVIGSVSHSIEWEYINSFGATVKLGDLDSDGIEEIVGASAWNKITVFEADIKTPKWEITTSNDIGALIVTDEDGNGISDIIYGDGQWGEIHAIDGSSHTEKWNVNNPEHGVSGIALADVDLDGKKEVIWSAGGTSTGPDYLYVADPYTGTIEWQNIHIDGPLSAVDVGDVDDDGKDEIVMVSFESNSGYAEGIIHIFDARTHALEYQERLGIADWMGVRSVRIGDVDDDGKTEFIVTTASIYDGVIQIYYGTTHTIKKQSSGYDGNFFSAITIGDVDGDGKTEIVAGQGREHTGADGIHLIVFDGATLQEKWKSVDLGGIYWGEVYDIKLADIDNDGHTEIIASIYGNRLIIYDGVSHNLKLNIDHPATALEIADGDGDGINDIIVGRDDGNLDVLDSVTFKNKKTISTFDKSEIKALRSVDLDGNGTYEWLVTRGNNMIIMDGQDYKLKWTSSNLSDNIGLYNQLRTKDTDADGHEEIYVGSKVNLYQFDYK